MPTVKKTDFITEEEYLAGEEVSEVRHEYIDGEVYAMAGAKASHNLITTNISGEVRNSLKGSPCSTFVSDMKVKVGTKYFYPDVVIDCSDMDDESVFTESPTVIFEVLSRSTRKRDETIKKINYLNIPTLQEYVLVEQDFVDVEIFRRSDDWRSTHHFLGEEVTFEFLGISLSVEDIYERTKNEDMLEWLAKKEEENTD